MLSGFVGSHSFVGLMSDTLLLYPKGRRITMDEESAGGQIGVRAEERAEDGRHLMLELRKAAKRRKRIVAWMYPLIFSGMAVTLLIGFRADMRLSIAIFCTTAVTVLGSLLQGDHRS